MIGVLLSAQGSEADFGIQSTHIEPNPHEPNPEPEGVGRNNYQVY